MDGPEEDDPLFCSSTGTLEVRTLSNSSICDDGGSMVDHLCEEMPLEACHGMGVAWSPRDYSDSSLVHGDEFHGVVHSSKIDLRLEYHPGRISEQDRHGTILRYPYEFLVISLGLTNAPTTYHIFLQLQRFMFLFFDALSIYSRTWEDPLRQLDETWGIIDTTGSFYLGHVVSAQDDRDRLRDDMIYYRGDTYLSPEATLREMIMRVMHDAPSVGLSGDLYEHEVPHRAELLYRKVSRLQAWLEYIIRSRDSRLLCVVWQEHDRFACMELIPSIWFPSVDCIQGLEMRLDWIPIVISVAQQQSAGLGSGGLPILWWDLGIHLSDRLLQMVMMIDRVVTVIGLLYVWDVDSGEVETYSIWQDRLSFLIPRIEVGSGFADLDFTETPLQGMIQDSGFSPFRDFIFGFLERRMQTGHVGPTMMIRVVQRQHGGSLLGLVWDPGITLFDKFSYC
jgi:hypothetical protein